MIEALDLYFTGGVSLQLARPVGQMAHTLHSIQKRPVTVHVAIGSVVRSPC